MPLTDDEAVQAFRFLVGVLRAGGLGWVITQVEEKIALGKVQTKKLRARDIQERIGGVWELAEIREPSSKRLALFAVAEEYAPEERLNILIDSIALAVPIVRQVAQQTFANLGELGAGDRLEFEPEAEVSNSFSLVTDELGLRAGASEKLVQLLEELRHGDIVVNPSELTH